MTDKEMLKECIDLLRRINYRDLSRSEHNKVDALLTRYESRKTEQEAQAERPAEIGSLWKWKHGLTLEIVGYHDGNVLVRNTEYHRNPSSQYHAYSKDVFDDDDFTQINTGIHFDANVGVTTDEDGNVSNWQPKDQPAERKPIEPLDELPLTLHNIRDKINEIITRLEAEGK